MKRCSFFCAGWWPFIVLPLLLLLPLLFFNWHSIEEKVADNASADLQAAGLNWVEVDTFNRGRGVLLSGTAPSQGAIDEALSVANNATGVRIAEFRDASSSIATPRPAVLNANAKNGVVTLSGVISNQETLDKIAASANSVYGKSNVVNKLLVGENTSELLNIDRLFATLDSQGLTDNFTTSLEQNQLTLNGVVTSDEIKTSIGRDVSTFFAGDVINQLQVVVPEPIVEAEPEVVAPAPVQRNVCEDLVKELLAAEKIYFQTGKADINQKSFALIDRIAATAKRCSDATFEVAGHTDSKGSLALNMRLSQARAQSVVNYLIELGLSAEQFSAKGYGPNQPIADNASAEGRAANRRIEFKLKN